MIWNEPADLSHVEGGPVDIQLWHAPSGHERALAGAGHIEETWPVEVMHKLEGATWGGFALIPTDRATTVEEGHEAIAQVLDDDTAGFRVRFGGYVSGAWSDGRRILSLVGLGEAPAALGPVPTSAAPVEVAEHQVDLSREAIDSVLAMADSIIDANRDADSVAWATMLRAGLSRLRVHVEEHDLGEDDERKLREQLISTARRILSLAKAGAPLLGLARAILALLGVGA